MASDTSVKTFVSSAVLATPDDAENERTIDIDEVTVTLVMPDINQVVLANAMIENATSNIEAGAALINIFFGLIKADEIPRNLDGDEVDEDDLDDGEPIYNDFGARKLQAKMMNPRDKFGIETIAEIMGWLLEEWSNRPTTPSSRSSASRKQAGTRSRETQRGKASTRGTTAR